MSFIITIRRKDGELSDSTAKTLLEKMEPFGVLKCDSENAGVGNTPFLREGHQGFVQSYGQA